jgi:hypothetical protein
MVDYLEIKLWGKEETLPIEYNCYDGESITEQQIDAINNLQEHLEFFDYTLDQLIGFLRNRGCDTELSEENIYDYVQPQCIFVKREAEKPRVALMCQSVLEEDGIAVIISEEGTITVSTQDMLI